MFGEDGWCRACGIPWRAQTGHLVLQRKGLGDARGAFTPNWRFDVICLDLDLATRLAERFRLELRDVKWPREGPVGLKQVVVPSVGEAWFDHRVLHDRLETRHAAPGRVARNAGSGAGCRSGSRRSPSSRTRCCPRSST
jgi:hypothetical protein